MALLCLAALLGLVAAQTVPTCPTGEYFSAPVLRCRACPANQQPLANGTGCICSAGFAGEDCKVDCVAEGKAASSDRLRCVACDGSTAELNVAGRDCRCTLAGASASSHVLVDSLAGSPLTTKMCIACVNSTAVNGTCRDCALQGGRVPDPAGGCQCPPNTELHSLTNDCLPDTAMDPGGYNVHFRDIGQVAPSSFLETWVLPAAKKCAAGLGGADGCQFLANMCVLQMYEVGVAACKLYNEIVKCTFPCERPANHPWLFYTTSPEAALQQSLPSKVVFGTMMKVVVTSYDVRGNVLAVEPLVSQIFLCEVPDPVALLAQEFGNSVMVGCTVNVEWLETAPEPRIFELHLEEANRTLVPIPVRITDTPWDGSLYYNQEQRDIGFRSPGFTIREQLYRRFMLYDNLLTDGYVRFASGLTLLFAIRSAGAERMFVPMVSLRYHTHRVPQRLTPRARTPPAPQPSATLYTVPLYEPLPPPVPQTLLDSETNVAVEVHYIDDVSKVRKTLIDLIIVSCCVSFATACIKTWAWQRRRQSLYPELFPILVRLFVYYCSHFSAWFTLVVTSCSAWYFIWFKGQHHVSALLPPPQAVDRLYTVLVWCAFATRLTSVLYLLFEQCTSWIYLLDWEQPRGKLKEGKTKPVSMWRSVFVCNELNELQAALPLRLRVTMLVVLLLLEAAGMQGLTTAQPEGTDLSLEGSYSHPVLRLALATFLWIGVYAVLWVWDTLIYHRFLAPRSTSAYVDLCSLSNISVFILLERRFGYYIHGKSVHQYADASVKEFQNMLKLEEEGCIPQRGMAENSDNQVFEFHADERLFLYLLESQQIFQQEQFAARQRPGGGTQHKRCYEYFTGQGSTHILTDKTMARILSINEQLKQLVQASRDDVHQKNAMHRFLGLPPYLLPGMPSQFYIDHQNAWERFLLQGIEHHIFFLCFNTFIAFDFRFGNSVVAMAVAYLLLEFIVAVRKSEGEANMGKKTMIDDRFLL